jgi:phosphoenolpyruvate---glycerone phosphotransferase subunit DhaK
MSNIINSSATLLQDALQGLGRAHAHKVCVDAEARLVLRKVAKERGKVALISGGGSGHEPMHAG